MKITIEIDSTAAKKWARRGAILGALSVMGYAVYAQAAVANTFSPGEVIHAADINANFAGLDARIAALETLTKHITATDTDVTFSAVNVHIDSGAGTTDAPVNGLGNLIVGYNEKTLNFGASGTAGNQVATGSHNLVVGRSHSYSSFGTALIGEGNETTGSYSAVIGGVYNTASGPNSSVSGGAYNLASGADASVTGGTSNVASGTESTVSGGGSNVASVLYGAVSHGSGVTNNLFSGFSGDGDYVIIPIADATTVTCEQHCNNHGMTCGAAWLPSGTGASCSNASAGGTYINCYCHS